MINTRLWLDSADLVDRLTATSPERRRQAAVIACRAAIAHSALCDPRVLVPLSSLADEIEIDDLSRKRLEQLAEALDREALDDPELTKAFRKDLSSYFLKFKKARAANAVLLALDSNKTWQAAAESIYEAFMCFDDDSEVDKLTKSIGSIL